MIFIAIGSNLPSVNGSPSLQICRDALWRLACLPGLRLIACAPWYITAPIPASAQADYVNGIAAFAGNIEPRLLLDWIQTLELALGRRRHGSAANGARVLDLDVIDHHGLVHVGPDLVLPHPRAHERGFVLWPLADIAPDWEHPRLHWSISSLLAMLPWQAVSRWQPADPLRVKLALQD